jgi:hypothetical protein
VLLGHRRVPEGAPDSDTAEGPGRPA